MNFPTERTGKSYHYTTGDKRIIVTYVADYADYLHRMTLILV